MITEERELCQFSRPDTICLHHLFAFVCIYTDFFTHLKLLFPLCYAILWVIYGSYLPTLFPEEPKNAFVYDIFCSEIRDIATSEVIKFRKYKTVFIDTMKQKHKVSPEGKCITKQFLQIRLEPVGQAYYVERDNADYMYKIVSRKGENALLLYFVEIIDKIVNVQNYYNDNFAGKDYSYTASVEPYILYLINGYNRERQYIERELIKKGVPMSKLSQIKKERFTLR